MSQGYHEPKDPRTGKAPEHQAAATKKKKPKWVDWRNRDIQSLSKIANGYNPFKIEVNNKEYELKDIHFYDSNGVVINQGRGWFGSNNYLNNFPVPETLRRLKPKFDGETFILPKKKDWYERKDPSPYAVLYIPIDYFDFEVSEVIEDWTEGQRIKVRYYVSRVFTQDMRQTPLTISEWLGKPYHTAKGEKILDEITDLEKQLVEKKKELNRV